MLVSIYTSEWYQIAKRSYLPYYPVFCLSVLYRVHSGECDHNKKIACKSVVEMWWHTGKHRGKWRGNRRMDWVASTRQTTAEHSLSSITTNNKNIRHAA